MIIGNITQLTEYDRNQRIEWLQAQLVKQPHNRKRIEAVLSKLQAAPVEVQLSGNDGRQWHLMKRADNSICLYWTRLDDPAHYVVWDSLDK